MQAVRLALRGRAGSGWQRTDGSWPRLCPIWWSSAPARQARAAASRWPLW